MTCHAYTGAVRVPLWGFYIALMVFWPHPDLQGQDTTHLKSVDIVVQKTEGFSGGKRLQENDSAALNLYRFNSLNMLLAEQSGLFIRNYGPGGLSSGSLRGGSAYHSALLWNGFNIQNPMLGQNDLSSIPVFLFDKTSVEYGGSSALWGSGAVSGSILLRNQSAFNKGTQTRFSLGSNSFGAINMGLSALYSGARWALSTKLYSNASPNTFSFRNDSGRVLRQQQAPYAFRGLLQEFRLRTGSRHELSLNAWLEANDRRIPPAEYGLQSKTYQKDRIARFTTAWTYTGKRVVSVSRAAAFMEEMLYTDSMASLFSKSRARTVIVENENFFDYRAGHRLHLGVNGTMSSALSDQYEQEESLQRLSVLIGHRSQWFAQRLKASVSLRVEYFSAGALPLTGNAALDFDALPFLKIQANAARVYRQPTLNELYWKPGGNPNLKPEQGYTMEAGLLFRKRIGLYDLSIGLFGYNRNIDNWVLWLPSGGQSSRAENIQAVWSRGAESEWKLAYRKGDFGWHLQFSSNYILSTVRSSAQAYSASLGKQLIYTPRYLFNGSAGISYENSALVFLHQYTGYRFTSADNSQWLDPFHLSSLRLNYYLPYRNLGITTFLACNNLFNSDYEVLQGRPMPLRNYELGLSFDWSRRPDKKIVSP